MSTETEVGVQLDEYKWGFSKPENYVFKARKGLSHEIVEEISQMKSEPQWMRDFRHKSLDAFLKRPMPTWGGDLSTIDFDDIYYYIKPTQEAGKTWDDLPAEIKDTFEKLGIPEAERKYLAGVGAQYESEVIYHKVREDLEKLGVIFVDPNTASREHEELFRKYFATVIPAERQQVLGAQQRGVERRQLHLHPEGRQGRDSAAGLLPHQRQEHGPVRADADHRRRGLATCITSRAARRRPTRRTACTARSSRSSSRRTPACATRRSRTGRRTSTTW